VIEYGAVLGIEEHQRRAAIRQRAQQQQRVAVLHNVRNEGGAIEHWCYCRTPSDFFRPHGKCWRFFFSSNFAKLAGSSSLTWQPTLDGPCAGSGPALHVACRR
jgi:hypothetical protein